MYVVVPVSSDRVNRDTRFRLSPALNERRLRERRRKLGFKVSDDAPAFRMAFSITFVVDLIELFGLRDRHT